MIDAIAFKELYKTVYQDLYRFALCMMHHPQDAEDAVSEAVLSAYENIHKITQRRSIPFLDLSDSGKCVPPEVKEP